MVPANYSSGHKCTNSQTMIVYAIKEKGTLLLNTIAFTSDESIVKYTNQLVYTENKKLNASVIYPLFEWACDNLGATVVEFELLEVPAAPQDNFAEF